MILYLVNSILPFSKGWANSMYQRVALTPYLRFLFSTPARLTNRRKNQPILYLDNFVKELTPALVIVLLFFKK